MKGHLSPWLFCDCVRCGTRSDVSEVATRQDAIRVLRRLGWWQDRRNQQWYCPDCKPVKVGPRETI